MRNWMDATMPTLLFARMLNQEPVWVDSPMGQKTWIHYIGFIDGVLIAIDSDGQDRPCSEYFAEQPWAIDGGAMSRPTTYGARVTTALRLPTELHAAVLQAAAERDISVNDLMTRLDRKSVV